jgi:hypothetical protein
LVLFFFHATNLKIMICCARLLNSGTTGNMPYNGWGCDQFGGAGLGIYPTLKSFPACRPDSVTHLAQIGYTPCWRFVVDFLFISVP